MLALVLLMAVAPIQASRSIPSVTVISSKSHWGASLAAAREHNMTVRAGLETARSPL